MKQLENIDLAQAKDILKHLRSYADMSKKLGLRGQALFMKNFTNSQSFTVEFFPALGEESAWSTAQDIFKKSFSLSPKREEITFIENASIKGGMKVYVNDDMVDLTYKKVENLMQK
ncbi:hypothetical protein LR010_01910 [Candidatus Gracilibacteria bacterium]|jgi:hypothetical protein|nr:hypothetical protein [Candidatus Gracilibacteria bacterium]